MAYGKVSEDVPAVRASVTAFEDLGSGLWGHAAARPSLARDEKFDLSILFEPVSVASPPEGIAALLPSFWATLLPVTDCALLDWRLNLLDPCPDALLTGAAAENRCVVVID